jgi:hypothetical protein
MKLGTDTEVDYQHAAYGTWGEFTTSAGQVQFLETKARLGQSGIDKESRLTKLLLPVREILDLKQLDFNQLLQRDLDDHRVAQKLVPYVLRPQPTGPAFFPPIVVALLPFDGKDPKDHFPEMASIPLAEDNLGYWSGYALSPAFKFEKSVLKGGEDFEIRIGRLSWNPERAKLVVIDGQHRAMALLAIDRTINNTWPGTGEKYRHFYEPVIKDILKDLKDQQKSVDFSNVEFPVNICWFPTLSHPTDSQQKAARKLFVDLNGNAKPPSTSRLMLLSDSELINIFSRRLLNEFREDDGAVPIYAIEYDHPDRLASTFGKWSVMSSLSIITACVKRSVFGPDRYISKVDTAFGSREPEREMDRFMRERLQLSELLPEIIEDGERTLKRVEVGNTNFPLSSLSELENRFLNSWGQLVVRMLQSLLPYEAHAAALKEMRAGWATGDSFALLAKDAIFEGVGMYWTLRDSAEDFNKRNEIRADQHLPAISKTDVVKAWEEIDRKRVEFNTLRSKHFLGKTAPDAVALSDDSFKVFNTHACQLGFVLTASTLAYKSNITLEKLPEVFTALIAGANAALLSGPSARRFGRRTVLARSEKNPLNSIRKLDTPLAPYFRYFWLELLATPEAQEKYSELIKPDLVSFLRDDARFFYFDYVESEAYKALRSTNPGTKDAKLRQRASDAAKDQMRKALDKWFAVSEGEFYTWLGKRALIAVSAPPVIVDTSAAEDEEGTLEGADGEEETLDDILKTLPT